MTRFGRKPSRLSRYQSFSNDLYSKYKGISVKSVRRRRRASKELVDAVDQIVAMVRPELSSNDRHEAAAIIAADVRPDARALRSTDVLRTRGAVAKTLRGAGYRLSNERRLTR